MAKPKDQDPGDAGLLFAAHNTHDERCGPPVADCHNSNGGNGEAIHQDPRSHALPSEDPDLAFIVGLWDRLADQCKARLIEVIQENLPS